VLIGAPTDAPADPLPLIRPAPQPLVTFARGLPILGDLLPRPPVLPRFTPSPFRVRLLSLPTCSHGRCYAALLLDVAPLVPKGL
jgi:hypothetical protein